MGVQIKLSVMTAVMKVWIRKGWAAEQVFDTYSIMGAIAMLLSARWD